MRLLILMSGATGSGKSTFINAHGLAPYTISPDDLRLLHQAPELTESGKMGISSKNEKKVWQTLHELLEKRMKNGDLTVIDATHTRAKDFNAYKALADEYRYRVVCVDFRDVDKETLHKQNQARPAYKIVPEHVVEQFHERISSLEVPKWVSVIKPENFQEFFQLKPLDLSSYKKVHHIGDVHGCFDALTSYLKEGIKDDEYYIFVGDYVDRGIQNGEVLEFLFPLIGQKNVVFLEGNHECFSKETEVLTNEGWKYFYELNQNESIAQFDIDTFDISYAKPLSYIQKHAEKLIRFESNNMLQEVTFEHDVIYNYQKVKARDLFENENLIEGEFPLFGFYQDTDTVNIEPNYLRLLTWIIMDGTIVYGKDYNPNSEKVRIQFKLSRQDKISNLISLLDEMNLDYTFTPIGSPREGRQQPHYIRIYGKIAKKLSSLLNEEKKVPKNWRHLSRGQLNIFFDVLTKSDGSYHGNKIRWTTTEIDNINIIQEACLKNGISCKFSMIENGSGFTDNCKIQYRATINPHGIQRNHDVKKEIIDYNDEVYCVTMPKGTVITRNKGKIAFSGNCHLWNWANDRVATSKEFEHFTKKELNEKGVSKKTARVFYRQLRQCVLYTYGEKNVLVTHGGLTHIPENLYAVSTMQLIKGVGDYGTEIDRIFHEKSGENDFQIHGHRNTHRFETQASNSSFNLEGQVELGGHLRTVTLSQEGFVTHEVPNPTYSERFALTPNPEATFSHTPLLVSLRNNQYIREKEQKERNISSFNFTRDAFNKGIWDNQTIRARGLFMNTETTEIVARSYEKFFNAPGEVPQTTLESMKKNMVFPVSAFVKDNGFLGITGVDTQSDTLIIASKSTTSGAFKEIFEAILYQTVGSETVLKMKQYMKDHNVSFVFEVNDPVNDPHMVKYEQAHVVLLDVIYRTPDFNKLPYDQLVEVANTFGLKAKVHEKTFTNWNDFHAWFEQTSNDFNLQIEGYVIEDSDGFMTKIKLPYYSFWKWMRSVKDRVARGKALRPEVYEDDCANAFVQWLHKQEDRTALAETDIITLREAFEKEAQQ